VARRSAAKGCCRGSRWHLVTIVERPAQGWRLTAGRSPWVEFIHRGELYEHDMPVENCECGVAFAGAEPREIWLSTNKSTGISPGREPETAKHGRSITARHNGLTGGVAEHLMTPLRLKEITGAEGEPQACSLLPPERRYDEYPSDCFTC
jgi:hypothetical protein